MNLRDVTLPAADVIAGLGLVPHPEGGHYRETWRDAPPGGERGAGTAIHFLLAAGERSHWHRVDAAEIWVWNAGAALSLELSDDGRAQRRILLGPDIGGRQRLQGVVHKGVWQAASPLGAWTLVTCIVAPAFAFAGFELAAPGWQPEG